MRVDLRYDSACVVLLGLGRWMRASTDVSLLLSRTLGEGEREVYQGQCGLLVSSWR